jgi:hypothetical protein
MTKPKSIKPEGQVLNVPNEKAPEVVEITYTQAKKLNKKPMSEKQAAAAAKLVELNRIKWEQRKKEKEEQEAMKQQQIEESTVKYVVKPKRVYPKKAPKKREPEPEPESESESESDSEEEEQQPVYQKPKSKPKKEKLVEINTRIQKLEEINNTLKNINNNPYASMIGKFYNR